MGVMLLPLAVLVASAFWSLNGAVSALEEVVQDPVEELLIAKELQGRILGAGFPIHHYVSHENLENKERYLRTSLEVDLAFDRVQGFSHLSTVQRDLLGRARQEWTQAKSMVQGLFKTHDNLSGPALSRELDRIAAQLDLAVNTLDQFGDEALEEIHAKRESSRRVKQRSILLLMVTFAGGLLVAGIAAFALARSVLNPIRSLEHSVNRLGEGDLSSRAQLQRNDELGHLASGFNAMAEQLEKVHSELEYLSTHDALTGLMNYRRFHEMLGQEIHRASRYRRTFCLLLIDIDHFAEVNQQYGHLVGDSVLCSVTNRIANSIRPTDCSARYAGEKVGVILSETAFQGGLETAERIRREIAENTLNLGEGKHLDMTVSIGMAVFPEDADSDTALFMAADQALNRAKALGRDRVCTRHDLD